MLCGEEKNLKTQLREFNHMIPKAMKWRAVNKINFNMLFSDFFF